MRISTKYGLMSGGLVLALVLISFYFKIDPRVAAYLGPLIMVMFIGFIFMSIKHTKERELGGTIDTIGGLKAGMITAILYALGFILANVIPVIVTPAMYMQTMKDLKVPGARIPTGGELFGISINFLISYSMIGGMVSMLTALILRTRTAR